MLRARRAYDVALVDNVVDALRSRATAVRMEIDIAATDLANAQARMMATAQARALLGQIVLGAQVVADQIIADAERSAVAGGDARREPTPGREPVHRDRSFWWQIIPGGLTLPGPPMDETDTDAGDNDPDPSGDFEREPDAVPSGSLGNEPPVLTPIPPPLVERVRVLRRVPPLGVPLAGADDPESTRTDEGASVVPIDRGKRRRRRWFWRRRRLAS